MTHHHDKPRDPVPPTDKVAEGSAKQLARGVGAGWLPLGSDLYQTST